MNASVKFFYPGMHLKRWLALLFVGIALMSLGGAYLLVQMYRVEPFPTLAYYMTLQFVDRLVRAGAFLATGVIATVVAVIQLNRAVLAPFLTAKRDNIF